MKGKIFKLNGGFALYEVNYAENLHYGDSPVFTVFMLEQIGMSFKKGRFEFVNKEFIEQPDFLEVDYDGFRTDRDTETYFSFYKDEKSLSYQDISDFFEPQKSAKSPEMFIKITKVATETGFYYETETDGLTDFEVIGLLSTYSDLYKQKLLSKTRNKNGD